MIKTAADLLAEIKRKGSELIKQYEGIDHPVLIGDMYEGLTQEILSKSVFDGLNLKVVGGKIKNSSNELSDEIDCMLVEGEGDKIPFTEKYIYHYSDVIAVIQVKKSLGVSRLDDAYSNLKSVINISSNVERDGDSYIMKVLRDSYRGLLRIPLPKRSELEELDEVQQYMYHTLLMEAYFPLRIVLGYYGYSSEYSLRQGFVKMLESKVESGPARGYGANSLPNLVICGQNSIVKNNGMPFSHPFVNEKYYWPLYTTSSYNPLYFLIEIIWTRLSYKYNISASIFGDDFDGEPMHRYIDCRLGNYDGDKLGWAYNYYYVSRDYLKKDVRNPTPWHPVVLSTNQMVVVMKLCEVATLNIKVDLPKTIELDDENPDDFINGLLETGLVYRVENEIGLLTDHCLTMILPDGRMCAGENRNGEFSKWLMEYQTARK